MGLKVMIGVGEKSGVVWLKSDQDGIERKLWCDFWSYFNPVEIRPRWDWKIFAYFWLFTVIDEMLKSDQDGIESAL